MHVVKPGKCMLLPKTLSREDLHKKSLADYSLQTCHCKAIIPPLHRFTELRVLDEKLLSLRHVASFPQLVLSIRFLPLVSLAWRRCGSGEKCLKTAFRHRWQQLRCFSQSMVIVFAHDATLLFCSRLWAPPLTHLFVCAPESVLCSDPVKVVALHLLVSRYCERTNLQCLCEHALPSAYMMSVKHHARSTL